ncbi:hypothetical protein PPSIR1_37994 [Plesiocystis pacifica SIR-1]|uniref:Uncharacterized protein n=1 Tax=Plesiocystis pacifica SIR-1 TaxID=391625 RepID=A6G9N8_9BACT|nr:hypothetical protein [Plesiocystis pacifica]EDM77432.1 hypothetical protein PPSIR1_37994 [Plesiocystis pacifica SIR-1]
MTKLCAGLDLMASTLFMSFETGARDEAQELIDLVLSRCTRDLEFVTGILRLLFDELSRRADDPDQD